MLTSFKSIGQSLHVRPIGLGLYKYEPNDEFLFILVFLGVTIMFILK